ncbi:MAG TPA: aminotransferase class V-fold PLP-dependent enzyme [Flavobacteriales bacterium]|nr:aminotransferase class V-fold PLP-dependent enzyme [Flavobacteriales bacterium]
MREKILKLEKSASLLEPKKEEREEIRNKVVEYTERFLEDMKEHKTFNITKDQGAGLYDYPISNMGISIEEAIRIFKDNVEIPGLNPASGGHLAYIPGGGIYHSSLGDYIAAITNRYAGVFYPSPGAVRMTNMLIKWMAELVGYPHMTGGNLTSGGSIANLTAVITARDAKKIKGNNFHRCVVYCTKHIHHCIDKAINIAGMRDCIRRDIKMDMQYKMNCADLEAQIIKDKKKGLIPWMVIGSAGTTDVGAIDPLSTIGKIAKRNNLWYHIDGAYGAFFLLTKEGKTKLNGIELSDSLVMDPHKSMFLPYGLGVLLVRNAKHLKYAHQFSASYFQDVIDPEDEMSPADISPELTKHFRALRMWLPLKLCGTDPFTACLEEKLLLTKYFYREIGKVDGFVTGVEPELSVTTFRYVPKNGDANSFNKKLLDEILLDGRIFLSSTDLDGSFFIRMAILAFRSHLETIDLALEIIKEKTILINNS